MGKIRLLTKQEIVQAQNSDRSKEIAEGLKLSRKVDSLRELKSKEEESLEKFRVESLSAIQEEISRLEGEKEKLVTEINTLRVKLVSSLPKKERDELEKLKLELARKEKEIDEKSRNLEFQELDIATAMKDSKDALERALGREKEAENLQKIASEERSETSQTLMAAKKLHENVLKEKEEAENVLLIRENDIRQKEERLSLREESNLQKERELKAKEIQLEDQRKTLERAMERLRKNRLA